MPNQTTNKTYVYYPDGAKVSVKASVDSVYTDLGAINSAVNATLNWDENRIETANAGTLDVQVKNMTIAGSFDLINLDPVGITKLGGGILTTETTTSTPTTTVDDQVIAAGDWVNKGINAMVLVDGGVNLKASIIPTITEVTASGVTGALVADDDYTIFADSNSASGFSIMINTSGSSGVTLSDEITIDYNSVTPVASTIVNVGASTQILSAYAMKITHTDDKGKIRQLELPSVDPSTGGFQFNFLGANEDGVEVMPVSYQAKLDTSLVSGKQLMSWTVQEGAQ